MPAATTPRTKLSFQKHVQMIVVSIGLLMALSLLLSRQDDKRQLLERLSPTTKSTTRLATEPLLASTKIRHDFGFCTDRKLKPAGYKGRVAKNNNTNATASALWDKNVIDIWYPCVGPAYEELGREIRRMASYKVATGAKPFTWGHRDAPMPSHTQVLLVGNSHTRQVGYALACQFGDLIVDIQRVRRGPYQSSPGYGAVIRVQFANDAIVWVVSNSYFSYSTRWQQRLEEQLGVPLRTMDAILVGVFNACDRGQNAFAEVMRDMSEQVPDVDCANRPYPTWKDFATVYDGPLGELTMFGKYPPLNPRHVQWHMANNIRQDSHDEDNHDSRGFSSPSRLFDMRTYIDELSLEGATKGKLAPAPCLNGPHQAPYSHRCTGHLGGYPDLTAWDVVEFLWEVSVLQDQESHHQHRDA